jgi:hypothetical protein
VKKQNAFLTKIKGISKELSNELSKELYDIAKYFQTRYFETSSTKEEATLFYDLAMYTSSCETEEQSRQMLQIFSDGIRFLSRDLKKMRCIHDEDENDCKEKSHRNQLLNHPLKDHMPK